MRRDADRRGTRKATSATGLRVVDIERTELAMAIEPGDVLAGGSVHRELVTTHRLDRPSEYLPRPAG